MRPIADPFAGEGERRPWKPGDLRKQGVWRRASREQARSGGGGSTRLCRVVLHVPGGFERGAKAPGRGGLSSRRVHELMTEGARAIWIGVALLHRYVSRFVAAHLSEELLCGESRSGPDPMRFDWPGLTLEGGRRGANFGVTRPGKVAMLPGISGGACSVWVSSGGHSESTGARLEGDLGAGSSGFESIRGCAHGSNITIADIGGAAPLHRAQAC